LSASLRSLDDRYETAVAAATSAAEAARANLDGSAAALRALASPDVRPPLIANVPVDELPPYVAPQIAASAHALVPDTPLIDSPIAGNSLAFDDAPLWQS
jgi:hypothetical protein